MDTRPYYERTKPIPQDLSSFAPDEIDFTNCHLPLYPESAQRDSRRRANALFDSRAAAVVRAAIGNPKDVKIEPGKPDLEFDALLERKKYGTAAPTILIPRSKCLAAMAFGDYFPDDPNVSNLQDMVSKAILAAQPGWCGTFGPDVDHEGHQTYEGNYDMTQMYLLPLAYAYYDLLTGPARERLISLLLARGRIHRVSLDDTFTNGPTTNDWSRAGYVSEAGWKAADIPETENHILMIATVRYLTNQLLYPRNLANLGGFGDFSGFYDNRRNGNADDSVPTCRDQVLVLLRNMLLDDFAEYNSKPYQQETRNALLNLFTYAYDAEVRLGAGMVLDYMSAHFAVSSCDLRRMAPFRRRDEEPNVRQDPTRLGFMDFSLLNAEEGADPLTSHFAVQAGNTRAYEHFSTFFIVPTFTAPELFMEAICDHRLAPSVHDLFVNDLHRRFYQRLHRRILPEPVPQGGQRNCDNMEIYAGSPSYLISAGGRPAPWVIFGGFKPSSLVDPTNWEPVGWQQQNIGVALPTSFMPVGYSAGENVATDSTRELIQILNFSDVPAGFAVLTGTDHGGTENYGVAPDFACGVGFRFPSWARPPAAIPAGASSTYVAPDAGIPETGDGQWHFLNRQSTTTELAGFYLAVNISGRFVIMEGFDTWRHPEVSFESFQNHVKSNNSYFAPVSGQPATYTTFFGNIIHYKIWDNVEEDNHGAGSKILRIEYGNSDPADTLADAGNDTAPFLSGTILKSSGDGKVEIRNPSLGTTLKLDWSDPDHLDRLIRTAEDGDVQQTGPDYDFWVDFDWTGPSAGDFYFPFKTLEDALNAIQDGGVIHIMTGARRERLTIHKRVRITAAGGAVILRDN